MALSAEGRQAGLDGFESAEVIGFELTAGFFLQRSFNGTVDSVAGIANHCVQVTFAGYDIGYDRLCEGGVIDVQFYGNNALGRGFQCAPAAAGIDFHTGLGQYAGGGSTDAAAASGYQNYFFHNSERKVKDSGRGI